jgi:anti-sigma-K factor RskA
MAIVRHNELRELLGVYALGLTDAAESAAVSAHLTTCAECRAELRDLQATVDALPLAAEAMDPPPALRSRIEAAILADAIQAPALSLPPVPPITPSPQVIVRPPSFWASARPWAAIAAALLVVTVGLLLWNVRLQQQLTAPPTAQTIALAPTDAAPGASGEARYDPEAQLFLLDVRGLPALPAGEVYQVWLIGAEGPVPVGVFDEPSDEHAIVADRGQFQAVAITNEPGPLGSPAPTGNILIQAAL